MKKHLLILASMLSSLQLSIAGTMTFKGIEFNDEGVPSKIRCIWRGSYTEEEHPPTVVAIDSERINYRGGYRPDEVKRIGDDYVVEYTIDLEDYVDILGRFDKSDWTLMLKGVLTAKRIGAARKFGGIDVIEILKIKDITIGFDVTHTKKPNKAEMATPRKPSD